jgi:hypothetical protein
LKNKELITLKETISQLDGQVKKFKKEVSTFQEAKHAENEESQTLKN